MEMKLSQVAYAVGRYSFRILTYIVLCNTFIFTTAMSAAVSDYELLKSCAGEAPSGVCVNADINGDGNVDLYDIEMFRMNVAGIDFNSDGKIDLGSESADVQKIKECLNQASLFECSHMNINSGALDSVIDSKDLDAFYHKADLDINDSGSIELGFPGFSSDVEQLYYCARRRNNPSCEAVPNTSTYFAEIERAVSYDLNLDGKIELSLSFASGDLATLSQCWNLRTDPDRLFDLYPQCDIDRDGLFDYGDVWDYYIFIRSSANLDLNQDWVVDLRRERHLPIQTNIKSSSLEQSGYLFAVKKKRSRSFYKKLYVWVPVNDNRHISYSVHKPNGVRAKEVLFGDIDRDGRVDQTDIEKLVSIIRKGGNDGFYDLNGDGRVTDDDTHFMEQHLLGRFRKALLLNISGRGNSGANRIEVIADDGEIPARLIVNYRVYGNPDVVSYDSYDDVMLVVNSSSWESVEIGDYYMQKRNIPPQNVVYINAPTTEVISRKLYEEEILHPIRAALVGVESDINYIVTTKGVPLRVRGISTKTQGKKHWDQKVRASVDSLLSAQILQSPPSLVEGLWKQCWGKGADTMCSIDGPFKNPYLGHMTPFSSNDFGFHIVTRLTAYRVEEVKELIDRAERSTETGLSGNYLFDADPTKKGGYNAYNNMISQAADALSATGVRVVSDASKDTLTYISKVAGYVSWGSNDCCDPTDPYPGFTGFDWLPGAIATTFVSTSARSFSEPMNYGQSTVADLIREGASMVAGFAHEPYVTSVMQPPILFECYVSGLSAADCFYAANPFLAWQGVIVGDPKMRLTDEKVW